MLSALRQTARILDERHQPWALVGGLAVSIRVEPRFTRDRPQDGLDLRALVSQFTPEERARAIRAVARIEELGANRGKALGAELELWLAAT